MVKIFPHFKSFNCKSEINQIDISYSTKKELYYTLVLLIKNTGFNVTPQQVL